MQFILADVFPGLSDGKLALFISGVALIFALRRWRQGLLRKRSRGGGDRPSSASSQPASGSSAGTENSLSVRAIATELSALLAELEETSRRAAAQIDNRRTGLELLLKEADEKIKRLETLTRASSAGTSPAEFRTSPGSSAAHDAAQTLSRLRQERGAPVAAEDPAYRPIYQMADRGKTAREIAQELGRQPGEVELILALRRRQPVG